MKRLEISIVMALAFCVLVSFCSFERQCEDIRSQVLRLHIMANSDSLSDQTLKLRVRDRLLEESAQWFSQCSTLEEAIAAAQEHKLGLIAAAEDEIISAGFDYSVNIDIAPDRFTSRTYGDITLPAGVYQAVQVRIGEGEGHNWWCVMFPAMCLPGSSGSEELGEVLNNGQMSIVEANGYDLRFRCVELYEQMKNRIG